MNAHPRPRTLRRLAVLLALAIGAPSNAALAATAYAVDGGDLLVFDTGAPASPQRTAITGLGAGLVVAGIDFRPQNGQLYALAYDPTAGTVQLHALSHRTGVARPIGAAFAFVDALGAPRRIGVDAGTRFGIDFNPAVDRLRVVNNAGQNFRVNPNDGAPADGNSGAAGIQMDGDVNVATVPATVDATAYTNPVPNTAATTQYTLDAATDRLFIQNPPNSGNQTLPLPLQLGSSALDFDAANGFDIEPGVDAPASNQPVASGSALAVLQVGGVAGLYRIDLTNGQASALGALGGVTGTVRGFAVHGESAPGALPAIALSADRTQLLRFATTTPANATPVSITGIAAGETLAGIDLRPATGQLFGLGVDPIANAGTLYRIDPQGGAATVIGPQGGVAFVDAAAAPVDLPPVDAGYGLDFNPTVDRLRVVTGSGLNFRLNPDTGAPIDGNGSVAGVNTDQSINVPAGTASVGATAYTNSFNGASVTSQYTLDHTASRLYIQNPPNTGTQILPLDVRVGAGLLAFSAIGGFDIPPAVRTATSGAAVSGGDGYAVLGETGAVSLGGNFYRIDLASGSATALGQVGPGPLPAGLAVGDGPTPDAVFADGFEVPLP